MSNTEKSDVWGEQTPTGTECLSPSKQMEALTLHDDQPMDCKEPSKAVETEGKKKKKQSGKPAGTSILTMTALKEQWQELQVEFQKNFMGMVDRKLQDVLANQHTPPVPAIIQASLHQSSGIQERRDLQESSGTSQANRRSSTETASASGWDPKWRIPIRKNWQTKNPVVCHRCKAKGHIARNCRQRGNDGGNRSKGGAKNVYNINLKG